MNKTLKKILKIAVCVAFWLGVWCLLSLMVNKSVILPSPAATVKRFWELLGTREFYLSCLSSLGRVFAGLLIGVAAGILLAILSNIGAEFIISPAVSVIKATPVASIIIVMLFFLKRDVVPITATALMVTPIIYSNALKGARSADKSVAEVAAVYGFSRGKRLKYVTLPAVVPFFSAGVQSAVGLAWKAGVAAEVLCTPKTSIGSALLDSKTYLLSEDLFAWTLTVIMLSIIIEKLLVYGISKTTGGRKND